MEPEEREISVEEYEKPEVRDYGDLSELTATNKPGDIPYQTPHRLFS